MTLVLGDLTLIKVRSFRIVKSMTYPRHGVVNKSTGTIDTDVWSVDPDKFEIDVEVNEADRQTLQDTYWGTLRNLADAVSGFSEDVHVEKVDCEYIIGRDYNNTSPSPECWRCALSLVLSNS